MSTSRETGRKALAELLETALVGDGLPVKVVTNSKPTTLKAVTPLVAVLSAGTFRERMTFQGNKSTFYLDILVYVQQAEGDWTNANAEDALDTIEKIVEETYITNVKTANWENVYQEGRTIVSDVSVEGNPYYVERIPTVLELAKA